MLYDYGQLFKGENMKAGYIIAVGHFLLILLWPTQAVAAAISGKYRLDNQNILILGTQKYYGQFDLRGKLPVGDEFVLSKVIVSFKFQDDSEWIRKAGPNSLENTGKIIRSSGFPLKRHLSAGRTDYHYIKKSIMYLTNEEEVAELTIGRTKYFGTTMRRRDVTKEILGQKSMMLGTYADEGDNHRIRQHYRITESVQEFRRDGYDGLFEIRRKSLDLASVQDLAHNGVLDFELAGKGDYNFMEATLQYEGYTTGQVAPAGSGSGGLTWLMLFSLPIGGLIWWKRGKFTSH